MRERDSSSSRSRIEMGQLCFLPSDFLPNFDNFGVLIVIKQSSVKYLSEAGMEFISGMKISSSYFEKDEKTKSWNNRNTGNEITNLFWGERKRKRKIRIRFRRERQKINNRKLGLSN